MQPDARTCLTLRYVILNTEGARIHVAYCMGNFGTDDTESG